MKLTDLLHGVQVLENHADPQLEIAFVTSDSRKVKERSLFVAVDGFAVDGNRFIPMALEKGAVAIVTAKKPASDIPYVLVDSDRCALARIAANYYGHPTSDMIMIGVTGTNGKTSVTWLLKQILENTSGARVGLIGTMENHIGDVVEEAQRTTPESIELQQLFARMRDASCTHCVMEVSSHAIALDRVEGITFEVAAFTNLTEDHLDFHKTMENYCDTKAQLFARCHKAVANVDDEWYERITAGASCPVLTTSAKMPAGLHAEDICLLSDCVRYTAVYGQEKVSVCVPIPGKFTVYNSLTAMGIALQLGFSLAECAQALANAQGVKGRVEVVPTPGKAFTVLIDYAHTPDGLENVLSSVKGFCKGRLIAVFGCGGDRDPIKRPIMGRIGTEIADFTIITSDNPRTEAPMAIIEDILKGVQAPKEKWKVIENRPQAIQYAIDIGEKDDIIVLAGKGHETYQEIMGIKHHLDEREIVAACLAETR